MPHSLCGADPPPNNGRKLRGHPAQPLPKGCSILQYPQLLTSRLGLCPSVDHEPTGSLPALVSHLSENLNNTKKLTLLWRQILIPVPCFFWSQCPLKQHRKVQKKFFFKKENISTTIISSSYPSSRVRKNQLTIFNQLLPFIQHSQNVGFACFTIK